MLSIYIISKRSEIWRMMKRKGSFVVHVCMYVHFLYECKGSKTPTLKWKGIKWFPFFDFFLPFFLSSTLITMPIIVCPLNNNWRYTERRLISLYHNTQREGAINEYLYFAQLCLQTVLLVYHSFIHSKTFYIQSTTTFCFNAFEIQSQFRRRE